MKIKTPLFKRLVAMIMVIAMVAGYVSVPSFAAEEIPSGESQDTTTEVNAVGFNVVVTREEKIANEVFAEGQAEGEEPVAVYVYTAELKIGDEDKTADAVFTWPGQAEEDGTYVSENPTVALSVEFDGIKLPVTTADTDEEQTFTLAAETKGVELAYVGAAIATEACEIKEGANFVLIVPEKEEDPKATWQTVWNEENVDDVDGTPVANKAATDLELAKVLLYGESGTTCYLEIPVTAQTVKNTTPKITVSVVRGESEEAYAEETWYQKNDTFKVTFATVGAVVLDAKYLTQYIIHGEDKLDWERVGDDWVVSYKLTETTSFGRFNIGANSVVQNYPVKVDTTDAKDIEIVLNRAYYNDGMLHVFWDHKAGESGIKSVDVYVDSMQID